MEVKRARLIALDPQRPPDQLGPFAGVGGGGGEAVAQAWTVLAVPRGDAPRNSARSSSSSSADQSAASTAVPCSTTIESSE
jgi:hypothetical protein